MLYTAGAWNELSGESADADALVDVGERMGRRIVPEELASGEGRGPGSEVVKSLRRDEPRLAGAENVEGFHAPEGLSTGLGYCVLPMEALISNCEHYPRSR